MDGRSLCQRQAASIVPRSRAQPGPNGGRIGVVIGSLVSFDYDHDEERRDTKTIPLTRLSSADFTKQQPAERSSRGLDPDFRFQQAKLFQSLGFELTFHFPLDPVAKNIQPLSRRLSGLLLQ